MPILVDVLIILASILALWKGSDILVEASARLATRFGISQLVIGLTIVAFGTSAPEFMVSLFAAARGQADLAVGNVVGSNIFNLGLILGSVALIRTVRTSSYLVYRDGLVLIAISFLLLLFLSDLQLQRWEGAVMVTGLVVYICFLIFKQGTDDDSEDPSREKPFSWWDILRLLGGLAAVVAGGHFFVDSASEIARYFGLSEWVIGVTIVAAGTSSPELATSLMAAIRGHHGISAGNLIGSDIFNILGVLGVSALAAPMHMQIDPGAMSSLYMMSGLMILVTIMMRTGWKLSRLEGGVLVLIGLLRWVLDFM